MRRRVLADPAADTRPHLGAVAPVHSAPYPRVGFLGMIKDEAGSGRLNVVLNWTEELKRLVPAR